MEKLQKILGASGQKSGDPFSNARLKDVKKALTWPFKKKEVKGILARIECYKSSFSLVLYTNSMYVIKLKLAE